jgi:hypothetical protein
MKTLLYAGLLLAGCLIPGLRAGEHTDFTKAYWAEADARFAASLKAVQDSAREVEQKRHQREVLQELQRQTILLESR